jgi:uncharacterized protein
MHPFSLLVKPAGGGCNLDCSYCFYKKDHAAGTMSADTAARAFGAYAALPFAGKSVALQGGEPLLAFGTGVFQILDSFPVEKSVQTNATLVTDESAEFLARGGWLVGASLDGPRELNRLRGDSFDETVRGIRRLERANADYNLLTVVSRANVARPRDTYLYLRDTFSTRFHQYIECTGPRDAITGEEWGEFLVGLFDEWIRRDARTVSVRLFDSIVSQMALGFPTLCSFAASCRQYLVVEHDGSVYPCDFHVRPELRLGNVNEDPLEDIAASPAWARFAAAKEAKVPAECRACRFFEFCRGDCPRSSRRLCAGWRRFFAHALPRLRELAQDACRRAAAQAFCNAAQ